MKDHYLLPFLLPNVFQICKSVSTEEFAAVLPKLQPLFGLKDSPQNLIGRLFEGLTAVADHGSSASRESSSLQGKDDVAAIQGW